MKAAVLTLTLAVGTVLGCGKSGGSQDAAAPSAPPPPEPAVQDMSLNQRRAMSSLLILQTAEFGFKQEDADKNGLQDFWTKDVAGLQKHGGSIPEDLAKADGDQPSAKPDNGYLFCALHRDEKGGLYASAEGQGRNKDKFAFCGYPATYDRTGRLTFIINQENVVYAKDTKGKPVREWPSDADLQSWKKLD